MKKNNTKVKRVSPKMSKAKMVAVGAGVAAVGVGAYYLIGPKGKAHQKKAKQLMIKMKREAISKAKKAKKITEPIYNSAVDSLAATYGKQYKDYQGEIQAIAKKLKGEWKSAQAIAKKTAKSAVKRVKNKI